MLFYRFRNYKEFKEIFGIIEHGNGVKSRKNKILLSLYKDKRYLKMLIYHDYYRGMRRMRSHYSDGEDDRRIRDARHYEWWHKAYRRLCNICDNMEPEEMSEQPLLCDSLASLKNLLFRVLGNFEYYKYGDVNKLVIGDRTFFSNLYKTDHYCGLCEDKTLNAIRYVNIEKDRTFKMKAGKMFNHIMSCNRILSSMPEQIQRWLSEEFVADWVEYARRSLFTPELTLHVDDSFSDIYDSERCAGYDEDSDAFGSCMVNDDQYTFYKDAVDAKAAYLTDEDDMIVARCVIYTNVHEEGSDKIWRLAERQYSKFCDLTLQRQLVRALIQEGHIDGFKRVGASCHDPKDFLDNDGNSLQDKKFWIPCQLEDGDTLSYQDSFKWYDYDKKRADNQGWGDVDLSTTDSEVSINNHEDECWSGYHDCYINNYDAVWVESRDDYFYDSECHNALVRSDDGTYFAEWCYEDDCVKIGDNYYFAGRDRNYPEDYGIISCPECDEWLIPDREESVYSDVTETWYDCESCLESAEKRYHEENGEVFSLYDDEWISEEDVLNVWEWDAFYGKYLRTTISIESFNNLVEDNEAAIFCGEYFIDKVMFDGEPVHEEHLNRVA